KRKNVRHGTDDNQNNIQSYICKQNGYNTACKTNVWLIGFDAQYPRKNQCSKCSVRNRIQPTIHPVPKYQFIDKEHRNHSRYHRDDCHANNNQKYHRASSFKKNTPLRPPKTVPQTMAHPSLMNRPINPFISIANKAIRAMRHSFLTDGINNPINMA